LKRGAEGGRVEEEVIGTGGCVEERGEGLEGRIGRREGWRVKRIDEEKAGECGGGVEERGGGLEGLAGWRRENGVERKIGREKSRVKPCPPTLPCDHFPSAH
jgi:hypothetical protein